MFYIRRDAPPFLSMCAEFDLSKSRCEENQKFIESLREADDKDVAFEQISGRDHLSLSDMTELDNRIVKLSHALMQKAMSGPSPVPRRK